jgi:hypothetical protein
MQHLALQHIGGLTVVAHWSKGKDKNVSHLMVVAQECLSGAKSCT